MATNDRFDVFKNSAAGKGYFIPTVLSVGSTSTSAAAASGFHTVRLCFNSIGSTVPGTLVGIPLPPSLPSALHATSFFHTTSSAKSGYFCNIYKLGTLNLASTGDQFTHDAATYPVLRTIYGESNKPLTLIPLIYITTATATTAPIFRLRTNAGAAGYVDQDGNSTVGTISHTLPSTTTSAESAFILRLESGDSGIRDISAIEVTTAGTAGAADVYGLEIIGVYCNMNNAIPSVHDKLFGGMNYIDIAPAVATSGTADCKMGTIVMGNTSAATSIIFMKASLI